MNKMSKLFVSIRFFANKYIVIWKEPNISVTTKSLFLLSPQISYQRQLATKASISKCLFSNNAEPKDSNERKITIVGAGKVGAACAFSLLSQNVTSDLCIINKTEDKAIGEMLDIQHGSVYLKNPKITASKDVCVSENSRIIIITAGAPQKQSDKRLDLLQRNADILKSLIPELIKHSPKALLIVVTNPVDVMTFLSWKVSGLPINQVIGSGTNIDSMRFRFLLAQRLKVATTSVNGYIIGEHGDSCVPVWSSVNVAGVRLQDFNKDIGTEKDPDKWDLIHKKVVSAGYDVWKKKGYTSWAIGLSASAIASAILANTGEILPVSTSAKCQHGIEEDVFLSLPCVLNANGVASIVKQNLTPWEEEHLHKSAKILLAAQKSIKL